MKIIPLVWLSMLKPLNWTRFYASLLFLIFPAIMAIYSSKSKIIQLSAGNFDQAVLKNEVHTFQLTASNDKLKFKSALYS